MTPTLTRRTLLQASALSLLAPNLPAIGQTVPQLELPIEDICHGAITLFNREMLQPIEGVAEFHRYFDNKPARDGDTFDLDGRQIELQHIYTAFDLTAPIPAFDKIIDDYVSPGITSLTRKLRQPGTTALFCRPLIQDDPRHGVRQHEEFDEGISLTITVAWDYIRQKTFFAIEGLFGTDPSFTVT